MRILQDKIPIILAVLLYILIYLVRLQQGGWEVELDLFPEFRHSLDNKIGKFLPSPQAELLSGIILGEKKDLPYQLRLALRDTSTLHIVVVSGQNLSLLAAILMNLSGLLKRKVAIGLTILVVGSFVILTGGQIPVLRAALMALLSYIAQLLGRQNDGFWVLCVVAALLLLINPLWIIDLSFQLSFLATFGVVVVAPVIANFFKRIPLFLRETLAVTLAAQIMVSPIIIQNFHQLSLISIPTNLLVLWTIPFIMTGGLVLLIIGSLFSLGGQIIAFVLQAFLTYFILIVEFFASLPFAWEYVGEKVWIFWVGYYLVLFGFLSFLRKQESN